MLFHFTIKVKYEYFINNIFMLCYNYITLIISLNRLPDIGTLNKHKKYIYLIIINNK